MARFLKFKFLIILKLNYYHIFRWSLSTYKLWLRVCGNMPSGIQHHFLINKSKMVRFLKFKFLIILKLNFYWGQSKTRPVWTGFKIAVRRKLLTHYYKVRCLDAIIISNYSIIKLNFNWGQFNKKIN